MIFSFVSTDNKEITIDRLSLSVCESNYDKILQIINIIPHISWKKNDLVSQSEDFFKDKWNYSFVIKLKEEIIGVIIAYFRIADDRHFFDSLYIHRFAIDYKYQNNGIGTIVLKYFIQNAFTEIPWLLNISVQTNDEISNDYVIKFYRKIGFKDMYKTYYSDKTDIVFLLERKFYNPFFKTFIRNNTCLPHPRLNVIIDNDKKRPTIPIVYFSSTNSQKKEIVEFIFHNYNIEVEFIKLPVELTEPQVEKADVENERKLVSFPLKLASRFITSTPCIIEDTMLFIEYFNRNGGTWELPGLDTKRWLRQLGLNGLLDIMGNTSKRKARFVSQTGAYLKSNKYFYGRGETFGRIAFERAYINDKKYGTYPYFFHLLFIPDGSNKTLAEMDMFEYAQFDYMRKSIVQLIRNISQGGTLYRQYTLFDLID